MKIAVCSKGNDLKSLCDERFGRCETFVIFDTETKENFAIVVDSAIRVSHNKIETMTCGLGFKENK